MVMGFIKYSLNDIGISKHTYFQYESTEPDGLCVKSLFFVVVLSMFLFTKGSSSLMTCWLLKKGNEIIFNFNFRNLHAMCRWKEENHLNRCSFLSHFMI